ncbi:MAG: hypothetical protein QM791_01850 [Ferruginibacter sp.]
MKARTGHLFTLNKSVFKIWMLAVCSIAFLNTPVFAQTVNKQLYLSDPSQALDRIDPVATADGTTTQTAAIIPTAQYLYAFRGGSRIDFWRYNIATNTWNAMANTPGTVTRGAALTTNGTYIYALRGGTTDFWRYDPGANSWSAMAAAPAAVAAGGALVHLNGAVYAFRGAATNTFWKYTISSNTWTAMANTPNTSTIDWGGALTTNGTDIFALRGSGSSAFLKYTVSTNTWSQLAVLPVAIDGGGSLSFDGVNINALRGGTSNSFYRYSISGNSWTALTNTTSTVGKGGALISDDQSSYAIRGGANSNFWKYNGSSWSSLANTPSNVDSGGAIIKMGSVGTTTTFTQSAALCSNLTIKAGTITVTAYANISYGTMPANPAITATIRYGTTNIITLSNPTFNSATNLLTWTATLAADVTVAAAQSISLDITTNQAGVSFRIEYDSQTKPSKIQFPVSTYINVNSVDVYTAAYPGGTAATNVLGGTTRYIRTVVSDPFGNSDINGVNLTVSPATNITSTQVAASGCTKVYESSWTVPVIGGPFNITATAKEGYENTVTHSKSTSISMCMSCPPTANIDYATGNGGEPLEIDVLANDADPNNNIDPSSLTVTVEPKNGQVILDNDKITYLPNGTFEGNDTLTYENLR